MLKVPVGPHREGAAIGVAKPPRYGRDVDLALDAHGGEEMPKVVVGHLSDANRVTG